MEIGFQECISEFYDVNIKVNKFAVNPIKTVDNEDESTNWPARSIDLLTTGHSAGIADDFGVRSLLTSLLGGFVLSFRYGEAGSEFAPRGNNGVTAAYRFIVTRIPSAYLSCFAGTQR